MTTSVYPIYRAIGRPITFMGLKAQYILYAALAQLADLFLFVLLYCCGISPWICIILTFCLGAIALLIARWLSNKYGQYGSRKHAAAKKLPRTIRYSSRQSFLTLKKENL